MKMDRIRCNEFVWDCLSESKKKTMEALREQNASETVENLVLDCYENILAPVREWEYKFGVSKDEYSHEGFNLMLHLTFENTKEGEVVAYSARMIQNTMKKLDGRHCYITGMTGYDFAPYVLISVVHPF